METISPGIYGDIDNADYHAGPGLSSSDLKKLSQSPLHYKTSKVGPHEETDAMRFGTAVHCAVLEPDNFEELYVKAPEGSKNSKAVKDALAEIEAAGKISLSPKDFDAVQGMVQAIQNHPLAGRWLSGGTSELSGYWNQHVRDERLNLDRDILCKCRPDYLKEVGNQYVIIDLKTTVNAEPDYFAKKAYWDYQYHISAAHYLTGMEALRGIRAQGFIFVAVEKTPPYAVNVFEASGNWPCYPVESKKLMLPRGARN